MVTECGVPRLLHNNHLYYEIGVPGARFMRCYRRSVCEMFPQNGASENEKRLLSGGGWNEWKKN